MTHQRQAGDIADLLSLHPDRVQTFRCKTQTVHATVHFQVNIQRCRQFGLGYRRQLPVAVYRGRQTIAVQQGQILWLEKTFQQQNRSLPAGLTQQDGFGQIQQGKTVGLRQTAPDMFDTVTIGIGLDHRPDFGFGGETANHLQVIFKSAKV
ncbi:hypothetical protein D3C78_1249890 [compost metagenome]